MSFRKRVSSSYRPENKGNWEGMMRELKDDMSMLERRLERKKLRK